jgi:hypothetical protein
MTNIKLTVPLKTWKDNSGRDMHRLGDLPVGITFKVTDHGPVLEVISYPRSPHTGKRQCKNIQTGEFLYEFCTKKVYVIE